ncbi:MAG: outer membrane protein assembly factor [Ignavibacteria bacterium]
MLKNPLIILFLFSTFASAQRYELQSILFEGNSAISSSELEDAIYSEETPLWFWKFLNTFTPLGAEPIFFDSTNIQLDLTALESYYNANGFFEAKVSYSYELDSADHDAYLTYKIAEGDPSNNGTVRLFGLNRVPDYIEKLVVQETILDPKEKYSESIIQQKIDNSVNIFLNNGYIFAKFDSTLIYKDTVSNSADIDIYFSTGNFYYIDTIIVETKGEGASYVQEKLIRKICDIEPGEPYSYEKIKRNQARLFRTGLFNSVVLSSVENDTSGNLVPLKLAGTIGYLNELSPEIILNNQQQVFNIGLGANYMRKNFLGEARKLTVGASFALQDFFNTIGSLQLNKFSFKDTTLLGYVDSRITIEQPFLFGKPIFGIWENYATINKKPEYNLTVLGSKLTFDFELPSFTFIHFLSTYYNIEQSYEVNRLNNDSLSEQITSAIGAEFGRTTADDILFPTRGYNMSFQIEEANSLPYFAAKIAGREYKGAIFYRLLFNSAFYGSLGRIRENIFGTKFKVGHLKEFYGSYAGIPLNRTFYAGGSNSIRGWRSQDPELIPEGTPTEQGVVTEGTNIKGGTFLLEGSLEWRSRFLESFGSALFLDYGNTWLGYKTFRFDQVAIAVGFGFRYYTQVAPFRIDLGFKFYNPSTKQYIWDSWDKRFFKNIEFHFGIGEAF